MNMKNDENQSEFFLDDKEFEKTMRKSRRKAIIKNVVITGSVLIALYGGLTFGNNYWLSERLTKEDDVEGSWLSITEPNIEQNATFYNWNSFSVDATHEYSKKIGERIIPWESLSGHYNLIRSEKASSNLITHYNEKRKGFETYNGQNGQRELIFYHPKVQYKQVPNDLNLLDEIGANKYVEYALSFDRPYSFSEVQKLLDKQNTEWLWVETEPDEEIQSMNQQELTGEEERETFYRGNIYGYPYNSQNDWQSPELFIDTLKSPDFYGDYADKAKKVLTRLKKDNPKLDSEKVKIVGAVVTGTPDELKKYQNKEFIRASSLGATIDKY
ncbi:MULTISPECIES: anti sigma factor C-terminal domain-containing protein [unclassified Bacillus (in: firmicutes)]|uniref:anti sigma factor C-terminal domain-containing protein n=1 Tax=unclassified Bacillus (in: firmicutes) TaxID=185979 RepID=UPI0030F7B60B